VTETFAQKLAADRRLVILRCLSEVAGYQANEMVMRTALDSYGHRVARDTLRADITFLKEHTLLRVELLHPPSGGELWLLHLLPAGADVAQGRANHYGIARPEVA
jgi:hypothetical protein